MSWVTAGTENGHTLQYRVTDCCVEKRVLHNGQIVRESVEQIENRRSRDMIKSYVNNIPRSFASRPPRHSSLRGGQSRKAKAMKRALREGRALGYRDYGPQMKKMIRSALRRVESMH
jgi:hypothetical protein